MSHACLRRDVSDEVRVVVDIAHGIAPQALEGPQHDEGSFLRACLRRHRSEGRWVSGAYGSVDEIDDDQERRDRGDIRKAAQGVEQIGPHLRLATRAGGWGATTSKKSFSSIFGDSRSAAAVSNS